MRAGVCLAAGNASDGAAVAVLVYRHDLNQLLGAQGGKGISAALTEGLAEFRGVNLGKADLYLARVDEDGEGIAVVDRNDSAIDGVRKADEKEEKEG
jgi:hypothetical protein